MKKYGGMKVTMVMINCEIVNFMEKKIYHNSDAFNLAKINGNPLLQQFMTKANYKHT
jgi:hypothetical protein